MRVKQIGLDECIKLALVGGSVFVVVDDGENISVMPAERIPIADIKKAPAYLILIGGLRILRKSLQKSLWKRK